MFKVVCQVETVTWRAFVESPETFPAYFGYDNSHCPVNKEVTSLET